jgi:hypothetical protein
VIFYALEKRQETAKEQAGEYVHAFALRSARDGFVKAASGRTALNKGEADKACMRLLGMPADAAVIKGIV